jgi:hypothetical protein
MTRAAIEPELYPQNGIRLLLQYREVSGERCVYDLDVYYPEALLRYELVCDAATSSFTRTLESRAPEDAPEPEPWVIKHMDAFTRKLLKPVARGGDWPRRILVWRER